LADYAGTKRSARRWRYIRRDVHRAAVSVGRKASQSLRLRRLDSLRLDVQHAGVGCGRQSQTCGVDLQKDRIGVRGVKGARAAEACVKTTWLLTRKAG